MPDEAMSISFQALGLEQIQRKIATTAKSFDSVERQGKKLSRMGRYFGRFTGGAGFGAQAFEKQTGIDFNKIELAFKLVAIAGATLLVASGKLGKFSRRGALKIARGYRASRQVMGALKNYLGGDGKNISPIYRKSGSIWGKQASRAIARGIYRGRVLSRKVSNITSIAIKSTKDTFSNTFSSVVSFGKSALGSVKNAGLVAGMSLFTKAIPFIHRNVLKKGEALSRWGNRTKKVLKGGYDEWGMRTKPGLHLGVTFAKRGFKRVASKLGSYLPKKWTDKLIGTQESDTSLDIRQSLSNVRSKFDSKKLKDAFDTFKNNLKGSLKNIAVKVKNVLKTPINPKALMKGAMGGMKNVMSGSGNLLKSAFTQISMRTAGILTGVATVGALFLAKVLFYATNTDKNLASLASKAYKWFIGDVYRPASQGISKFYASYWNGFARLVNRGDLMGGFVNPDDPYGPFQDTVFSLTTSVAQVSLEQRKLYMKSVEENLKRMDWEEAVDTQIEKLKEKWKEQDEVRLRQMQDMLDAMKIAGRA